jgi:hypothetical protein
MFERTFDHQHVDATSSAINRAAGSLLSRLRKAGLVRQSDHVTFSTW